MFKELGEFLDEVGSFTGKKIKSIISADDDIPETPNMLGIIGWRDESSELPFDIRFSDDDDNGAIITTEMNDEDDS